MAIYVYSQYIGSRTQFITGSPYFSDFHFGDEVMDSFLGSSCLGPNMVLAG